LQRDQRAGVGVHRVQGHGFLPLAHKVTVSPAFCGQDLILKPFG
jgi:hypothetical protein